ncbi:hypothetical protein C4580_01905 [Candidatus Woesearchaeota archaeon]|nr:MAG: hypothetical protein C4580_01905 [Candidatus Woesearchaeota archaeon]
MKLSIDTQADSKDDLRKVIALLQGIIGEELRTTNLAESPLPSTDVSGLMSLFDNTPAQNTPPAHAEDLTDPSELPALEFY